MDATSPNSHSDAVPGLRHLTWRELRTVLSAVAVTPAARAMVENLTEATRLQSPFLPPEEVRREIGIIVQAVICPEFPCGERSIMT